MRAYRFVVSLVFVLGGCGGGAVATNDAAVSGNDAASATDAYLAGHDAASAIDAASPGNDAGSTTCSPTPGSMTLSPGCDLLQLAVLDHDGAPSELLLTGRIYPTTATGANCAVVDGVDIVQGSATSTLIQHIDGGHSVLLDSSEREIARGVPSAVIASACTSDDPTRRFDGYGIVIRGRVDGGTFEAHCARAEGGSRWPPALRITCHHNVDAPPSSGNAGVTSTMFMGTPIVSSNLSAAVPHGPAGALTTLDSTIHVIAQRSIFDSGAPIASHDTTGWTVSANESGGTPPYSQLQAFASTAQFDTMLCPPPMMPGPGYVPPPAFLARLTGQGGHGAYATEVFINGCGTTSGP